MVPATAAGISNADQRRPSILRRHPVRLLKTNGETIVTYGVTGTPHPQAVAVGKRRIIVVNPDDSWTVIEPLLIVSLDYAFDAFHGQ